MAEWTLWGRYTSHRPAWKNLMFHQSTPESHLIWKVEKDERKERGWRLMFRTDWGNDEHRT